MSDRMLVAIRTFFGERRPGPRADLGRKPCPRRLELARADGFTLIEALMASVILIVGLIGLLGLLDVSVKASASTHAREGATSLARQIVEDARTIPYAQIIPTSIECQLKAMPGLKKLPCVPGWQVERRGFSYTVAVKECAIDDPKDGLAKTHDSKIFCEGQQEWKAGEAEDTTPENLKRITAEVSWTFRGRTSTVKQVSTLTAAGQAIGLVARELKLTSAYNTVVPESTPTTPVITNKATEALTFSVSFPEGTSKIIWSLEGAKQKELPVASSKETSLTFPWTINGVSDGTYQVAAQAVNSTGVIGPPISIPVRLIRGVPAAPSGIVGGFNTVYSKGLPTEVAELQWQANAERNVIGYRVFGPNKELVCPKNTEELSTATSCIDFDAGKPPEGEYTVVALYRDANQEVQSSSAGKAPIKHPSSPPEAPSSLEIKPNTDGSVTLKWVAPTGGTTAASFYRIYRGSKNYTSRYGETTSTEFTDTDATPAHEYWITAVSSTLTESTFQLKPELGFLGPVTG
jgi:type II secretory pathway pseudopilin PulG